jgi:hypothetical protein
VLSKNSGPIVGTIKKELEWGELPGQRNSGAADPRRIDPV